MYYKLLIVDASTSEIRPKVLTSAYYATKQAAKMIGSRIINAHISDKVYGFLYWGDKLIAQTHKYRGRNTWFTWGKLK